MQAHTIPRHVVYALTSEGGDAYAAMTRLSLASLRLSNPDCNVTLVCDRQTHAALTKTRDRLLDEADEVLAQDTPPGDAQYRNRFLKTSLRKMLSGAFLFLDSDTLIRGRLDEIFTYTADLAAALNHSADEPARQRWQADSQALLALGWPTCPDRYFNSGVIFFNDTAGARTCAESLHQKWLQSCDRLNRSRDQPAFNAALHETGPRLAVLPHRFNAQFRTNPSVADDAVIWHYYASTNEPPMTEIELIAGRLGARNEIDRPQLARVVARAQPWRRENWLDDVMIRWVRRRKKMNKCDRLWFQGRRLDSLRARGRKILGFRQATPSPPPSATAPRP
ncbi:MAG: glycosyltransferase [Verrucomicrobiota bacterium]